MSAFASLCKRQPTIITLLPSSWQNACNALLHRWTVGAGWLVVVLSGFIFMPVVGFYVSVCDRCPSTTSQCMQTDVARPVKVATGSANAARHNCYWIERAADEHHHIADGRVCAHKCVYRICMFMCLLVHLYGFSVCMLCISRCVGSVCTERSSLLVQLSSGNIEFICFVLALSIFCWDLATKLDRGGREALFYVVFCVLVRCLLLIRQWAVKP
jgi:hypothetical protein